MGLSEVLCVVKEKNGKPARKTAEHQYAALCPVHEDSTESLSIGLGDSGKVLLHCHAGCKHSDIVKAFGLNEHDLFPEEAKGNGNGFPRDVVAYYQYRDADNSLLFEVVRYKPKDFRQRRPDPNNPGHWLWNVKDVKMVLYRLPELCKAIEEEKWVFLVEGEKDVDNLRKLGLTATCNRGGAGKWNKTYSAQLRRCARVFIIPDNDDPGRAHALHVRRLLNKNSAILELPRLPPKGDASDWIAAGGSKKEIGALAKAAWENRQRNVEETREKLADGGDIVPDKTPMRLAEIFIDRLYGGRAMGQRIRYYAGSFWVWRDGAYHEQDPVVMNSELVHFLDPLRVQITTPRTTRVEPVPNHIGNRRELLDVLPSVCGILSKPAPCWLDERNEPDPTECISFKDKLYHLGSDKVIPATPLYFGMSALPFEYSEQPAACPLWLNFLNEIFDGDYESIQTLREWFGYCLTPDTRLQKILFIHGPKRCGKGTISKVLERLLGKVNVTWPSLGTFSTHFGLQDLIGKTLAIIPDARLSYKADPTLVLERLLSISGEDSILIDRKFGAPASCRLTTRLMITANEVPRFTDASDALSSRYVMLSIQTHFFGREDPMLRYRFYEELPGILQWAILGWESLMQRGKFVVPARSASIIEDTEELANPVGAFYDECVMDTPGAEVLLETFFDAWKKWCKDNGRDYPGTVQNFVRDLRTSNPRVKTIRKSYCGRRTRFVQDIALR